MAKSVKLDIEPDYSFILMGMVTSEPIYRISWLINQALHLNLSADVPLKLMHSKRQVQQEFEVFRFVREENEQTFELIQNKGQQGPFIEEHKQIDYLFKISGETHESNYWINKLKPIKNISLIFEIKPGSLKSKNRLIY